MSKKHKKVCRVELQLNYIEHLLILISTVTGRVFISTFATLVGIPIEIMSSAVRLIICVITAEIKKSKSIIQKKKKKYDKIVLLAKSKLHSIEVLISQTIIDSSISHDEFVLINDVLREFYDMKEEIKNSNDKQEFKLYIKQCFLLFEMQRNYRK